MRQELRIMGEDCASCESVRGNDAVCWREMRDCDEIRRHPIEGTETELRTAEDWTG